MAPIWQILQSDKISSVAISSIQFDGTSATHYHVPESLSVDVCIPWWGMYRLVNSCLLEDVLLCPMFLLITLHHLYTFLLIVANSRWSALGSNSGVWQTHDIDTLCIFITLFIIPHFFHHSIILTPIFVYRHTAHLSRTPSFSFRIPC